jgi:hypothetical protein
MLENVFLTVFFAVPDPSITDWESTRIPCFAIYTQPVHSSPNIRNADFGRFVTRFRLLEGFVFDHVQYGLVVKIFTVKNCLSLFLAMLVMGTFRYMYTGLTDICALGL